MSSEEVAEAGSRLEQFKGQIPPREALREFLRLSREARVRNPEAVAKWGKLLLEHHRTSLAEDEAWLLHEQVGVALLELGALADALPLVKAVLLRFPDSVRAKRLQGLFYEAQGQPQRARELYEAAIDAAPHEGVMPKALAALCRSVGQLNSCIDVLRTYLEHFSNDREGWEELADAYTEACMYRQAAFCWEEVLSMGVLAPAVLLRYADTLASIGGAAQLRTARAYYAQALQVSGGRSVRALYGLLAVAAQLPDKESSGAGSGSTLPATELPREAAAALVDMYAAEAPDKLPLVQAALSRWL